jgi:hypothetical protein
MGLYLPFFGGANRLGSLGGDTTYGIAMTDLIERQLNDGEVCRKFDHWLDVTLMELIFRIAHLSSLNALRTEAGILRLSMSSSSSLKEMQAIR